MTFVAQLATEYWRAQPRQERTLACLIGLATLLCPIYASDIQVVVPEIEAWFATHTWQAAEDER